MEKLSVIIPCFNEEDGIKNLHHHLMPVIDKVANNYLVEVIIIDDGSKDTTYRLLNETFGYFDFVRIIQHESNRGLGAALRTGIQHSTGDLVAMLDSDCSYHPAVLLDLITNLDANTDIVTASGVHPDGKHIGIAKHRLLLTKTVSKMYSIVLGQSIYAPTAMIKIQRRKVVDNISFKGNGFMAVTEMLVKALINGYSVKEIPYTNQKRQFGTSKMKLISTASNHLSLLSRMILYRSFKKGL